MTKIEALELELEARKMVDGTELDWWEVVRHYRTGDYELARGIIEGKPVWIGDTAYWTDNRGEAFKITVGHLNTFTCAGWSWNPPRPKTIMVELPLEVVKNFAEYYHGATEILATACRKALEEVK